MSPAWASHLRTLLRSSIASLVSLAIELGVVQAFDLLKIEPMISYIVVQILGTIMTFAGNKYWAFEASRTGRTVDRGLRAATRVRRQLRVQYRSVVVRSYACFTCRRCSRSWALRAVVWLAWNYPMNRWWLFRRTEIA